MQPILTGQSGSPVFKRTKNGLVPIGIHTYGGHSGGSATPIGPVNQKANPL